MVRLVSVYSCVSQCLESGYQRIASDEEHERKPVPSHSMTLVESGGGKNYDKKLE